MMVMMTLSVLFCKPQQARTCPLCTRASSGPKAPQESRGLLSLGPSGA